MRVVLFYHSLVSDWNHGNAHFLRGVMRELQERWHDVTVYEPRDAWSVQNLVADHGEAALRAYRAAYPGLVSERYDSASLDLDRALAGADLVIVHDWNEHELVRRIGAHRARVGRYQLLFHDTHHRSVDENAARPDLSSYDGVLASGEVVRGQHLSRGGSRRAWNWHAAVDTRVFRPYTEQQPDRDLVCIGNWRDGERADALEEFVIAPVQRLGLRATIYGARYPEWAQRALADVGIHYGGWISNTSVPQVCSRFRVTVHVPRRNHTQRVPGIPTTRPFEAMACGIPLISAPWDDSESLFRAGRDYLVARDGHEMEDHLRAVLADPVLARSLARHGLETVTTRHTCAHRVEQLLAIHASLTAAQAPTDPL